VERELKPLVVSHGKDILCKKWYAIRRDVYEKARILVDMLWHRKRSVDHEICDLQVN
jgi:hypothetical protein